MDAARFNLITLRINPFVKLFNKDTVFFTPLACGGEK